MGCLLLPHRRRLAQWLCGLALLWLLAASTCLVPARLCGWLESLEPPFSASPGLSAASANIKYIVVLGGGVSGNRRLPLSSQLAPATLARLVEGLRLHRQYPGSTLILSGGPVGPDQTEAGAMRALALGLGAADSALLLEEQSLETREQVLAIKKLVGTQEFILVTSAAHMARSAWLCRRQGLKPIPAPTDYLCRGQTGFWSAGWLSLPDSGSIRQMETVWYEACGLLRGAMQRPGR
jgi:uncharacterized SAM-binding protein YcdF (DUF218 family)